MCEGLEIYKDGVLNDKPNRHDCSTDRRQKAHRHQSDRRWCRRSRSSIQVLDQVLERSIPRKCVEKCVQGKDC